MFLSSVVLRKREENEPSSCIHKAKSVRVEQGPD
jgi:hypothetical protein